MLSQLYAIHDLKTQVFYPPFCAANEEHACRQVRMVLRRGGEFAEFPGDYQLWHVGTYSDGDAAVERLIPCVLVCGLDQLMSREVEGQRVIPFSDRSAPPHGEGRGGPIGPIGWSFGERISHTACQGLPLACRLHFLAGSSIFLLTAVIVSI